MSDKVSCIWQCNFVKITWHVIEMFRMVGYFQDTLHIVCYVPALPLHYYTTLQDAGNAFKGNTNTRTDLNIGESSTLNRQVDQRKDAPKNPFLRL